MRVTIFAGISGFDKSSFIRNLILKYYGNKGLPLDLNSSLSKNFIHYIKFEDELLSRSSSSEISSFLRRPSFREKTIDIEQTFTGLKKIIRSSKSDNIFLDIHLSYFFKSEFFPPLFTSGFKELLDDVTPVKVITLMDDVFVTYDNLKSRESLHPGTSLRLREILSWRSVELLQAEGLAMLYTTEDRNVRNYLISIRHPFETFSNLIFDNNPVSIYLSFPISKTRRDPNYINDINTARTDLHGVLESNDAVLFDPVTIDELPLSFINKDIESSSTVKLEKQSRWPIDNNLLCNEIKWPIEIPGEEIQEAKGDIENQIRVRDFKLIDNSLFTIVYKPMLGGPSTGVNSEISYTISQGKRVYVYDPIKGQSTGSHPFDNLCINIQDFEQFKERILEYILFLKKRKPKSH